jgi:hypothetical protein
MFRGQDTEFAISLDGHDPYRLNCTRVQAPRQKYDGEFRGEGNLVYWPRHSHILTVNPGRMSIKCSVTAIPGMVVRHDCSAWGSNLRFGSGYSVKALALAMGLEWATG